MTNNQNKDSKFFPSISYTRLPLFRLLLVSVVTFVLVPIYSSDSFGAERRRLDKGAMREARKASEGTNKIEKGLTEALALAGKSDVNSWNKAKRKIQDVRTALRDLEVSAAARRNPAIKKHRKDLEGRVDEIYNAADGWLPAALGSETPHPDAYGGGDKEKLRSMLESAWKKKWPTDEIIAVRLSVKDWKHTVERFPSGAIIKDKQSLSAIVYVKESANIATGWAAFVNRDNLAKSEDCGVATKTGFASQDVAISGF